LGWAGVIAILYSISASLLIANFFSSGRMPGRVRLPESENLNLKEIFGWQLECFYTDGL